MSENIPYRQEQPYKYDDIPGALPSDEVARDLDLKSLPAVAKDILENLSKGHLDSEALWRDWLALTGEVRTFHGSQTILQEWNHHGCLRHPKNFVTEEARISCPAVNTSWVDVPFTFTIVQSDDLVGNCSGVISLIPNGDNGWKVWMFRTVLENFEGHGHPDKPCIPESQYTNSTIQNSEFSVVIVGAGQAGLSLAGRLGALGISYLLLEREAVIGHSWTGKYDSVKQHTIKEYNNLPFGSTFKPEDPDLLPAATVAEGFQNYAKKYNLNVWLSAKVEHCNYDSSSGWTMVVHYGEKCHLIRAPHLALTMGAGLSVPVIPNIPEPNVFKGEIVTIDKYKNSLAWKGKTGIVVGSGTSGHDIAQDMFNAGLSSVTMIQRSKTAIFPVEWAMRSQGILFNNRIPNTIADRASQAAPAKIGSEIIKRHFRGYADEEPHRFDPVEKAGFNIDRESTMNDLIHSRGGGYYIDIGTSTRIGNGDIKVKSGVTIKRFTPDGLLFNDDSELKADVVVLATGYQRDARLQAATIIGDDLAGKLPPLLGLDAEGETRGVMKPLAPRLWMVGGSVAQARWNSRFVALQIQADILKNT